MAWPTQASVAWVPAIPNRRGFAMNNRHAFTGVAFGNAVTIYRPRTAAELRTALQAGGNRIICPEKSFTAQYNTTVTIGSGNCWFAGQTAPSPGVTIRASRLRIQASNVLLQHLRLHLTETWGVANGNSADTLFIGGGTAVCTGVVLHHCDIGFSFDELYDITANASCIVDFIECSFLYPLHCTALRPDQGTDVDHAHGPRQSSQTASIVTRVSWQGCMLGHNKGRGPRTSTTELLIANTLHYNCQSRATEFYGEQPMNQWANVVGNVYKTGPDTEDAPIEVEATFGQGAAGTSKLWLADNWHDGSKQANQFLTPMLDAAVPVGLRAASIIASSKPEGWVGFSMSTSGDLADLEEYVLGHVGARPNDRNASATALIASYDANGGNIQLADTVVGSCSTAGPNSDVSLTQNTQAFTEVANPWNQSATQPGRTNIEVQLHAISDALNPTGSSENSGEIAEVASAGFTLATSHVAGSGVVETRTATDTISAKAVTSRAVAETATAILTVTSAGTIPTQTISESGSVSDAVSNTATVNSSRTETASAIDLYTSPAVGYLVSVSETLNESDSYSNLTASVGRVNESGSASNTQSAIATVSRVMGGTSGAAVDSLSAKGVLTRAVSETVIASESLIEGNTGPGEISESVTSTDTVDDVSFVALSAIAETATATDSVANTATTIRSVSEAGVSTDALASAGTIYADEVLEDLTADYTTGDSLLAAAPIDELGDVSDDIGSDQEPEVAISESSVATDEVEIESAILVVLEVNEMLEALDTLGNYTDAEIENLSEALVATDLVDAGRTIPGPDPKRIGNGSSNSRHFRNTDRTAKSSVIR